MSKRTKQFAVAAAVLLLIFTLSTTVMSVVMLINQQNVNKMIAVYTGQFEDPEQEDDVIIAQNYIIKSRDCFLLMMTWLYFMKQNKWKRDASQVKPLNRVAMELKNSDMDRYWLFCYEALTWGSLPGEWRKMKQADISFIKQEIVKGVPKSDNTESN